MDNYEIVRFWFAGSESVTPGWMYRIVNNTNNA